MARRIGITVRAGIGCRGTGYGVTGTITGSTVITLLVTVTMVITEVATAITKIFQRFGFFWFRVSNRHCRFLVGAVAMRYCSGPGTRTLADTCRL